MTWKIIESKSIIDANIIGIIVSIEDTAQNLLLSIKENSNKNRVFFGHKLTSDLINAISNLKKEDEGSTQEISLSKRKKKFRKIRISTIRRQRKVFLKIERLTSIDDLTYEVESDRNSIREVVFPLNLCSDLVKTLKSFKKFIDEGKYFDPAKMQSTLYGTYYPNWMANHDRSMLAFKLWFDTKGLICNVRLDENPSNSVNPVKIERSKLAKKAKEFKISFFREKKGDDGWFDINSEIFDFIDDDLEICFDWEHRRDWVLNHNNIPIYMEEKTESHKKQLQKYFALDYKPGERKNHNVIVKSNAKTIKTVIKRIKDYKNPTPYFIYSELGQFERKLKKPLLSLTIQCSQFAPQWKAGSITMLKKFCYPETNGEPTPKGKNSKACFAVAWHIDFGKNIQTMRKASVGGHEWGSYASTANFRVFQFTCQGVKEFRSVLIEQLKTGVIIDDKGKPSPTDRNWFL